MSVASGSGSRPAPAGTAVQDRGRGASRRRTVIAPSVVETVAAVTAGGVRGVHTLGGAASGGGVLGRVRSALPGGDSPGEGVQVELGQVQAAFDLTVVAEYGVPLREVAERVRERVIDQVEGLTGYEVTEVNIAVVDVYDDEGEDT